MVTVGLPEVRLVNIDKRDNYIEGIPGRIKAGIACYAVHRCRVQARISDIRGDYQCALVLGSQERQEYDDVENQDPG